MDAASSLTHHVVTAAQQLTAHLFTKPILRSVKFDALAPGVAVNDAQPVTDDEVKAFMTRWGKLFGWSTRQSNAPTRFSDQAVEKQEEPTNG